MKKYELEGFIYQDFPNSKDFFYSIKFRKKIMPKVYALFKKEGIMPTMYANEWFICLFSRNLDFKTLVRIFHMFVLEGYKVIYRFTLSFIKIKEDEFLKAKDGLISIKNIINKSLENPDIDVLFKIVFGFSLSRNDWNKLTNEYNKVKDDKNNEFVKQL